MSVQGALDPQAAKDLVRHFLEQIQGPELGPGMDASKWIALRDPTGTQPRWEHAKWFDGASLERELYSILDDSCIPISPDVPSAEQVQAILRRKGPFVALVEEGERFKSLVNRQALLDQVTERLVTTVLNAQKPTKE